MQIKQVISSYDRQTDINAGQFKFCPFCSALLETLKISGLIRPVCPDCGFVQFRNPFPGVVVVIEKDGQILLGRRAGGFGKGKWGLPQGYIEFGEDFLTAAIREVKEETGLEVEIRSVINVVSNFLSAGLHTLAIVLQAGVVTGELCVCDDLDVLEWFPLSGPLPQLAFDADDFIIRWFRETHFEVQLPVDPTYARGREML